MDDDDVRAFLADPEVFVASDASATAPDGPGGDLPVHPREYGTFPRALRLARDERLLPARGDHPEDDIVARRRFGLRDRGRLTPGSAADVVVFDPSTVCDIATFERPHAFGGASPHVVVNGTVAWSSGRPDDQPEPAEPCDVEEPAIGFEPMTYRLQVGCATGLRHAGGTRRVYSRRNDGPDDARA